MHPRPAAVWLPAVLAATLGVAACDPRDVDEFLEDIGTSDTVLAGTVDVSPKTLEFNHRVRRDDCPQLVGRIIVHNSGTTSRLSRVKLGAHLGVRQAGSTQLVDGVDLTLAAGQTVEIEVYFACTTQTSFSSKVTVTTGTATSGEVEVKGTVG
jgi:hypothetical protein